MSKNKYSSSSYIYSLIMDDKFPKIHNTANTTTTLEEKHLDLWGWIMLTDRKEA